MDDISSTTEPHENPAFESKRLDEIWLKEAEQRLFAYRENRLKAIPTEEVFIDNEA